MIDGVIDHLGHAVMPNVNIIGRKPFQQWQHGCPHLILFESGLKSETEANLIPSDDLSGFRHFRLTLSHSAKRRTRRVLARTTDPPSLPVGNAGKETPAEIERRRS